MPGYRLWTSSSSVDKTWPHAESRLPAILANAYIEREIDARIELGLDMEGEAIAMSLATALRQESLGSQAAYLRDGQRRIRGSAKFRDKVEHAGLSNENAALKAEIAQLRGLIK